MHTPIHSSFTGRELIARGPLQLTADQAVAALPQLSKIGIGMDSALVGPAGGNPGAPVQFLQTWLPGVVRQVTKIRNIDALVGVQTVGSWEDEEVVQTASELTGKAELYGDVTNIPLAGYNATYERRSVIRFEQGMMLGRLEDARASRANISMDVEKRAAVADSLDIIRDKLVRAWNQVASKVGLSTFAFSGMASDGTPSAGRSTRGGLTRAAGGNVPGWSPNDTADNIPAWLTADEFVTRRKSARKMRKNHPGVLEYINAHGTLPGYRDGGTVARFAGGGSVANWDARTGSG